MAIAGGYEGFPSFPNLSHTVNKMVEKLILHSEEKMFSLLDCWPKGQGQRNIKSNNKGNKNMLPLKLSRDSSGNWCSADV